MAIPPAFWSQVDALFAELVDRSAAERVHRLEQLPQDDPVRLEVTALLAALESPRIQMAPTAGLDHLALDLAEVFMPISLVGRRLGPWSVVREVGRGGMGVVYEAIRADALYEQRVALKTLTRGIDSALIARRFQQERQILAALHHSGIARLLDGGVTEEGLPYLVMEFVEGLPIDQFCVTHRLPLRRRLDLFRQVCAAVGYAHRHLVVHRDIKPSNVLVTREGEVKLLDFGIAKLQAGSPVAGAEITETGIQQFTAAYASPEQVQGQRVSTASDVYSLGAMLYLLVTGRLPFEIADSTPAEALRRIAEEAPALPSRACTGEAAASMALPGRARLSRELDGELDDIIVAALRKEPDRRYATVAALSEDIQRYLRGQQVSARPDTWRYRLTAFRRRNPRVALLGGVAGLALVLGTVVSSWQARTALQERERAISAEGRANQVVRFLENMLTSPVPGGLGAARAEQIARAVEQARRELAGNPLALAAVYRSAGGAYVADGQFAKGRRLLDSAFGLDLEHAGPRSAEMAKDLLGLAQVQFGLGDYGGSEALLRAAEPVLRERRDANPADHEAALSWLGLSLMYAARPADAVEVLDRAVAATQRRPTTANRAIALGWGGMAREMLGQADSAEARYREALAGFDALGIRESVERATVEYMLAAALHRRGEPAEGARYARRSLESRLRWLGTDHLDVAHGHSLLARVTGRIAPDTSLVHIEAARRIVTARPTMSVLDRTAILADYTRVLMLHGRWAEAELESGEVLAVRRAELAQAPLLIADAAHLRGQALSRLGRYPEAERLLLESHRLMSDNLGDNNDLTGAVDRSLLWLYLRWGRPESSAEVAKRLPTDTVDAIRQRASASGATHQ